MINRSLISTMYETASIQRWNDHIRPATGFSELDKQAHKMVYAYVLGKCEGEGNYDPLKLLEGGIFEFLQRIVLTDKSIELHKKVVMTFEQIEESLLTGFTLQEKEQLISFLLRLESNLENGGNI